MNAKKFVKHHGPSIERDLARLKALSQICDQVEGVTTARVLHADFKRQKVSYERLPLKEPITSKTDDLESMARVGKLLAKMHTAKFSVTPEFSTEPYPLESLGIAKHDAIILNEAFPPGWFHSDFWHGNVFTQDADNIVVIDPLPATFMFSGKYIIASGVLDVAMMYMSLVITHPILRQRFICIPLQVRAAEAFFMSYLKQRNVCDIRVINALRRVICIIAEKWISAISTRLAWPLCIAKKSLATKSILTMEKCEEWMIS